MGEPLQVLVVDDSEDDTLLMIEMLREGGFETVHERVCTRQALQEALAGNTWQILLCDYNLPGLSLDGVLTLLKETGLDIPVIVVSGAISEDALVTLVKSGVHDVILKQNLARLVPAVKREMEEAEFRYRYRQTEAERAKLSGAIEQTADAVMITDIQGIIEYVNPAFEATSGFGKDEAIGKKPNIVKSGEHGSRFYKRLWKTILSGKVFRDVFINRSKDGSIYYEEKTITPLKDAAGNIISFISSAKNVTERMKMEERLRLSQVYANIGTLDWEIRTGEVCCSVLAARLFGGPEEELNTTRENVLITVHPDDRQFARDAIYAYCAVGTWDYDIEYRVIWPDGTVHWLHEWGDAVRDAGGAPLRMLAMVQDVTTRKLEAEDLQRAKEVAERSLAELSGYLQAIGQHALVSVTDIAGHNIQVNNKFCEASGYSEAELLGKDYRIINSGIHPKAFFVDLWTTLERGIIWRGEICNRAKDGALYWADTAIVPLKKDGQVNRYISVGVDVTGRKQAEAEHQQLEQMRQQNLVLEEASRLKSEFLATMSHELRTPLNAIIGFSDVLKNGLAGDLTDNQREYISNIFSSGQHLLSLINDILDLSKMEAGKMTLDLGPVDVYSLFKNSLSIVKETAVARGVHLELAVTEDSGVIQADARKVKQIVYNLLSNAVKFSTEGGHVTLRVHRVPRAEVGKLSGRWAGLSSPLADSTFAEFFEINVTDNGIGISGKDMEQMFQPFTQIDRGLARRFEGTGLGLAMVKQLAELHSGTVAVESAKRQGSCFTVWIPLRPPEGERLALVVEDDDQAAELIRIQLEQEGFKVLLATNAEAALDIAIKWPLALITLDILLPGMSGGKFLTRIKQVPELAHIPVVIISSMVDRNMGLSSGAAATLQKPVSHEELHGALASLGLQPPLQGRTLSVLVVDDDPSAVSVLAAHLEDPGYTVLRAYGGREAIDTARQMLPDLVILDLLMPEVSGFDVVEALRGNPDTARIPILVVTAIQVTDEERAMLKGKVMGIVEKTELRHGPFIGEVQRAVASRRREKDRRARA